MAADDAAGAGAHQLSGENIILLAQCQKFGAHGARKPRPVQEAKDDGDAEIDEDRAPGDRHDGGERQPERNAGDRLQHLDDALDDEVENAAAIACEAPDHDAEDEAHGHAEKADGQRYARTIDDARQHVAAKPVGAQQEHLAVLGGADEVDVGIEQPPEGVAVATAEEAEFLHIRRHIGIDAAQIVHVEAHGAAIDEGADELAVMEEVNALRRSVDVLHVARVEIIGCQKLADEDREIGQQQEDARIKRQLMLPELPPHQLPLRCPAHHGERRCGGLHQIGIEGGGGHVMRQRLAGLWNG